MGVIYQDEDGNEISPDQLDQYEEVGSYDKPVEGFPERTADKTIANFYEKFGNLFGGGEAFLADNINSEQDKGIFNTIINGLVKSNPNIPDSWKTEEKYLPEVSYKQMSEGLGLGPTFGLDAERGMQRKRDAYDTADIIRNSGQFENNTTGKIGDIASKAIADTAGMGAAFINPTLFAAEQGIGTLGREYADLKDQGYGYDKASATAIERGGFDAANNYIFAPLERLSGGYLSGIPKIATNLTAINAGTEVNRGITDEMMLQDKNLSDVQIAEILKNAGSNAIQNLPDTIAQSLVMGGVNKLTGRGSKPKAPEQIDPMADGPLGDIQDINPVLGLPEPPPEYSDFKLEDQLALPQLPTEYSADLVMTPDAPAPMPGLPEPQLKLPAPEAQAPVVQSQEDYFKKEKVARDITRYEQSIDPYQTASDVLYKRVMENGQEVSGWGYIETPYGAVLQDPNNFKSFAWEANSKNESVEVARSLAKEFAQSNPTNQVRTPEAMGGPSIEDLTSALVKDGRTVKAWSPETASSIKQIDNILNPEKPLTSSELRTSMDLLNQDPTVADETSKIIIPQVYEKVRSKFSADAFLPESTIKIDARDPAVPYEVVTEMPTLKEEFAKPELVKTKIEEPTTGEKSFPDSIDSKLKKAQEIELQNPPEKLSSVGPEQQAKNTFDPSSERGSINLQPIADFATRVKDKMVDIVRAPEDLTKVYDDLKKEGIDLGKSKIGSRELDFLEKKLSGRIFNQDRGQVSKLAGSIHKAIILPRQLSIEAEQVGVPNVKSAYNSMHDRMNYESLTANEYMDSTKSLMDLADTTKLAEVIQKIQIQSHEAAKTGKKLVVSDEALRKQGLTDPEITAYKAGRASADKMFDTLRDTALEQAVNDWQAENPDGANRDKLNATLQEIKSLYAGKKVANYWPIHRFGDYAVWAEKKGPDGKVTENFYNLHEKVGDRNETVKNLIRRGFKPEEINTYTVKVPEDASAAYASMPSDVRLELDSVLGKSGAPKGFKAHMLPRKMVPGAELDPQRTLAEYLTGGISYSAKMKFNKAIVEEVNKIDESIHPELKRKAQEWVKGIDDNSNEYAPLRTWLAHKHLGILNPAAAAFNATQPLTTTYPELYHMGVKNPMGTLIKSYSKADSFLRNPEKFAKNDPKLAEVLTLAQKSGIIDDSQMRDLYGISAKGTVKSKIKTFTDYSMALNSVVEKRNRASAFIAAYENAPKNSTPEEAFAHARDFVTKTQFGYTKGERPAIGKGGAKAALYQFRTFGHNYMSNLKNVTTEIFDSMNKARIEENPAKKAQYIAQRNKAVGTLARYSGGIGAIGGAKAVPFYVLAKTAFQLFSGVDPEKEGRKIAGDSLTDFFLYGGLGSMPGGIGMSSSLMTPEMSLIDNPSNLSNFGDAAMKYLGGAAYGQVTDIARGVKAYDMTGSVTRGLEEVMPRTPKGLMVAGRWASDGDAKNLKGQTVMEDPTSLEIAQRAMGFMPARYSKALRKESDYFNQKSEDSEKAAGWTRKIALAQEAGDYRRVRELSREAKDNGVTIKRSAVEKIIRENANPRLRRENSLRKSSRGKISE